MLPLCATGGILTLSIHGPPKGALDDLPDLVKSGNPATEHSDMSFPECPSDLSKIDKPRDRKLR